LVAYGYEVGPPALHAAALEPQLFASLTLQRAPLTWTDMVHTKLPDKLYLGNQWYVNLVHGALAHYDLADLIACIPKERLTVLEPVNCWNQPLAPAEPSPVPK
jgi:hypothetical protein